MVSPFALHQQQLAMLAQQQSLLMAAAAKSAGGDLKNQQQLALLAQQQSLLMAAAAKSAGGDPKNPGSLQQPVLNGSNIPVQSWPSVGYPTPGVVPMASQGDLLKLMQVLTQLRHHLICYSFVLISRPLIFLLSSFWFRLGT